jgi:hypothetical protein
MNVLLNLLKQPLIQFLLLGAVIFAADLLMIGREVDPRRILIDDAKYAEIAGIYQDNQGRAPSEQEMMDLTIQWAQNEVLYREARLMRLDQGDEMIRQRLILKLRNILFNQVVLPSPSEDELRAWFEDQRERYDQPATFDFEQFRVGGPADQPKAQALAAELEETEPSEPWQSKQRRYRKRPVSNLVTLFGQEDAQRLIQRTDLQWVPVSSTSGWHLSRITNRYPGQRVTFEQVRSRVGEDRKSQANQLELGRALRAIAQRYDIRVELTTPPAGWSAERIEEARLVMQGDRQ